jgi:hypothetical protein
MRCIILIKQYHKNAPGPGAVPSLSLVCVSSPVKIHHAPRLHRSRTPPPPPTSAAPVSSEISFIVRAAPALVHTLQATYSAPLAVVAAVPSARLCFSLLSTLYLQEEGREGCFMSVLHAMGLWGLEGGGAAHDLSCRPRSIR